jgi:hypothetical protein
VPLLSEKDSGFWECKFSCKLSTKITPHLEEGNRQTEQESEKQSQFIYTAELCEEKDFENVSIPHLSVQNKTARVQQKKESCLLCCEHKSSVLITFWLALFISWIDFLLISNCELWK